MSGYCKNCGNQHCLCGGIEVYNKNKRDRFLKKDLKTIKKEAIKHYSRMINWAKKQNPIELPKMEKMEDDLGEAYDYSHCSYCNYFKGVCWKCSLIKEDVTRHHADSYSCCDGLWRNMLISLTWKEWLFWAKKIKGYIKWYGLRRKI